MAVISNLSSFAVAKIIAIKFGPEGIGQYGAFMGLVSISIVVGSLGIPAVIPSWVGNRTTNTVLRSVSIISACFGFTAVPIIGLATYYAFAKDAMTGLSIFDLVVAGLTGVFTLTYAAITATFVGTKESAFILGCGVVTSSLVSVGSVTLLGLPIFRSVALGACGALTMLATHWMLLLKRRKANSVALRKVVNNAKELMKSGLSFWFASIGNEVALSMLPAAAFIFSGALEAGNFKSGLSIATAIAAVTESWIIYYFYPKLSKTRESNLDHTQIVTKLVKAVILSSVPIVIFAQVFSGSILSIFFSNKFVGATQVLIMLAPTMLIRTLVSGNLAILRSRTMVKELAICEWTFALVILLSLATSSQGLSALSYVYILAGSYLSGLLSSEIYLRRNHSASVLSNITILQSLVVATTTVVPILSVIY